MAETATRAQTTSIVPFKQQLQERVPDITALLPAHMPVERFIGQVWRSAIEYPALAKASPASRMSAVLKCAASGLRWGPPDSYFAVYGDKVEWDAMVRGLLTQAYNTGLFKSIMAETVRAGDQFDYYNDERGQHLFHKPTGDDTQPITHAYAMAFGKDGGVFIEVLTAAQIERRRRASKAPDGPMWKLWIDQAGEKCALRGMLKRVPTSIEDLDRITRVIDEGLQTDPTLLPEPTQPPTRARERLGVSQTLDRFGGETPGEAPEAVDSAPTTTSAPSQETTTAAEGKRAEPGPLTPHGQALETARELGRQHRRQGVQRRALPPQYREAGQEAEAQAWREGWDDGLS